jgi:hypothetical protein
MMQTRDFLLADNGKRRSPIEAPPDATLRDIDATKDEDSFYQPDEVICPESLKIGLFLLDQFCSAPDARELS